MRRRAAAAGLDPELPGFRHDLRDRPGGAEQGNPGSRRAVSGFEVAPRAGSFGHPVNLGSSLQTDSYRGIALPGSCRRRQALFSLAASCVWGPGFERLLAGTTNDILYLFWLCGSFR